MESAPVTTASSQPQGALIFVGPHRAPPADHRILKRVLWAGCGLLVAGMFSLMFPPVRARVSLVKASAVIWLSRGNRMAKLKAGATNFAQSLEQRVLQWRSKKSSEGAPTENVQRPTPVQLLLKKNAASAQNKTPSTVPADPTPTENKTPNPITKSEPPSPVAQTVAAGAMPNAVTPSANGTTPHAKESAPKSNGAVADISGVTPASTDPAPKPSEVAPSPKAAEPVNA